MKSQKSLPFFTLLIMISFASVNAVLFTPALPTIANYFSLPMATTQQTITLFLVGYAIGQLIYGPLANRFGRKFALYLGIVLQILSSILCAISGLIHDFSVLILGRFLLALGSSVGLKMTFTLINETYEPIVASQKISYLMIAFAITPGLGIMIGGFLNEYFNWESTFYTCAIYGVILLILVRGLPETKSSVDINALTLHHLIESYKTQFKNIQLISSGMLMGSATCFVYVFAALAPFIAIDLLHMTSASYGIGNLLPPVGLILGSLISAQLSKKYRLITIIFFGIFIAFIGSILMISFLILKLSALLILFVPMMFCYGGLSLVLANASTLAMQNVIDKAHGSAVMNFINMGFATLVVLSLGLLPNQVFLMPLSFVCICGFMFILYHFQK